MKNYMRNYRKTKPDLVKIHQRNTNKSRRRRALLKIDKSLACSCCGRKDPKIIQIHHVNRNGSIDRKKFVGARFYQAIINGTRKVDDLELRCVICNLEDYIQFLRQKYPN